MTNKMNVSRWLVVLAGVIALAGARTVHAQAQTAAPEDHWRFEGFVDNVADRYIILRVWNTFFYPDPPARPFATVAPPRRYGLRATYNF